MSVWEKFTHKRTRWYTEPRITLTKAGYFNLNTLAMEKYFMKYKFVILFYDKENKRIGFKLTNQDTRDSYKIRKYRQNKLGNITAMAFLKYYKIPYEKTLSYSIEQNENDEMLIINL